MSLDAAKILRESVEEAYYEESFEEDNSNLHGTTNSNDKINNKSSSSILKEAAHEIDRSEHEHPPNSIPTSNENVRKIRESRYKTANKQSESFTEENKSDNENELEDDSLDYDRNYDFQLHHACYSGDKREIRYLLEKRVNILNKDRHGWTPLHWAAAKGFDDIVTVLVNSIDNSTTRVKYINDLDDITGWSALHLAYIGGHKKTIELLLDFGASKDIKNFMGETPEDCICTKLSKELAKIAQNAEEKDNGDSKDDHK